ncbi:MAG: N-domain protein, SNF2 family, partial [Oscillospiraceae bacterium]
MNTERADGCPAYRARRTAKNGTTQRAYGFENDCLDVKLGWEKVAERINRLMRAGRYTRRTESDREEEIRLVPDVAAYQALKAEHPHHLVGVKVDDNLLFYGDDATVAAPLMDTKLLERDIPDMGTVSVTGMPFRRWRVAAGKLTENGHNIYFAEPAEQGGYEVVKELNGRTDTPHYQVGDTVYLGGATFLIEEITDTHVTMRDPTLLYPISRVERRETFEQMLAEDIRNDALFYDREEMPSIESVAAGLDAEEPRQLPQEETAPYRAQNFHITDEHLGEGGAKTKFGYNIAAIRTLKQIEAEDRQAHPDEQEILSRYVGWGGIPQAFDGNNAQWSEEYRQLKSLLTEDEYDAARGSTLNAHYTSPLVIRAMYDAVERMGFRTGTILEPSCGVGNFFGMLPESMAGSRLYGVELDSITGRIARQLYPDAQITISGFEKTQRRDFFDLAVGNVPFGGYKVSDKQFDKYNFLIHDYFFAKTLEQVRPGGVIAYITSKGTMDKAVPDARRYIAQRAELLGAIRLPNTAFSANAGTSVTTDILFLQKRESPIDIEPDWGHLGQTEDGIPINSYFVSHPDMMLGSMAWDKSMYGDEKETTCRPIPGADLQEQLTQAIQQIGGEYRAAEVMELSEGEEITETIPADPDVKNYSYALVDGEVYFRENSVMVRPKLNRTAQERVKGMVALRDTVYRLMDAQLEEVGDETIEREQRELNRLYDAFSAKFGLINDRANRLAFADDSSYY